MTTTDKLLDELNESKGLTSEKAGYAYFADIKGDGRNLKSVYTVYKGGVIYSNLNAATPRKRCQQIRMAIQQTRLVMLESMLQFEKIFKWV